MYSAVLSMQFSLNSEASDLDSCVIACPYPFWTPGSSFNHGHLPSLPGRPDSMVIWLEHLRFYVMQLTLLWNTGTVSSWLLVSRHSPHWSDGGTRHAPATGVLAMRWSSNLAQLCGLCPTLQYHKVRGCVTPPSAPNSTSWTLLWAAVPLAFIVRGWSGLSFLRIVCSSAPCRRGDASAS